MISLADLQRRIDAGDLSADAAIAQSLEAIGAQDKTIGAFVCRAEMRARQTPGRCAASPSASRTSSTPRFSDRDGLADLQGISAARGRGRGDDAEAGGRDHHRQDHDDGVCGDDPTATLNPHNHGHTPGGSSSGSAAAVAPA